MATAHRRAHQEAEAALNAAAAMASALAGAATGISNGNGLRLLRLQPFLHATAWGGGRHDRGEFKANLARLQAGGESLAGHFYYFYSTIQGERVRAKTGSEPRIQHRHENNSLERQNKKQFLKSWTAES